MAFQYFSMFFPVPVRFSGFLAGYPVPGFRSRSGCPVSWPVIRYPASGPSPVFRLAGRPAGRCWMLGVGCWSVGCSMLCSDRKMFCFVRCWANVCWCSATCWILTFVGVGLTMFGINPARDPKGGEIPETLGEIMCFFKSIPKPPNNPSDHVTPKAFPIGGPHEMNCVEERWQACTHFRKRIR